MPHHPHRHIDEPVEVDAVKVVLTGTAAWFVAWAAVLVLLVLRGGGSRLWSWQWTCLAGWLLGLLGLYLTSRGRRRR